MVGGYPQIGIAAKLRWTEEETREETRRGPLDGIRVVDLSTVVTGPFATQVLGDLGADVIKVEPPGGDALRSNGSAATPGMSALFLHTNRNKRSIVLDLKTAEDRRALLALIQTTDVLVHSSRADAMRRLGLHPAEIAASNPQVITCVISGFGEHGPYAGRAALDDLIQTYVGLPSLEGRVGGHPHYVPIFMARISALFAVQAIIAALIQRKRTGRGEQIDVPMFETLAHLLLSDHLFGWTFEPPLGEAGYVRALTPERRPYTTSNGYLCANIYNDTHWKRFCEVVGAPEFKTDPRFIDLRSRTENFGALCDFVTGKLSSRTTDEWLALLNAADIPAMPLHTLHSLIDDLHLRESGFLAQVQHPTEGLLLSPGIPTRWSRSRPSVRRHAPRLGEHSREIMQEVKVRERAAGAPAKATTQNGPPLAGIRVIDLTSVVFGPYATQLMADLGADVIKVEPPKGDAFRYNGPARHRSMSAMYLNVNRNKRSVVLDLKHAHGREALLRLIRTADVLVFNVRPNAMARLGLTYEDVAAVNPRIIYCSAVGYGQSGPYAAKPAYDELIQGAVALPWLEQQIVGRPQYVPMLISDRTAGLTLLYAMLAALYCRDSTGQGQAVEVPMFETMAQLVLADHLGGATFQPALGEPGYRRALSRNRGPFPTRDGYLSVSTIQDRHWKKFCAVVGEATLERDTRFIYQSGRVENSEALFIAISEILSRATNAEWLERLRTADVPVAAMNTLNGLLEDPHLIANGFIQFVNHPTEGKIRTLSNPVTWASWSLKEEQPAPRLGEHTESILSELGYTVAEIVTLTTSVSNDFAATRDLRVGG
jgi:crotonobetainyl-CoA:carnitine CoA-transferase CaiB-like acyl-CoA transferase